MTTIATVGVLGGGLMGSGIAQVSAANGFKTIVREVDDASVARARASIEKSLAKAIEKGKLTDQGRTETLGRLTFTTKVADLAPADIVVEAIIEDLELKNAIWKELNSLCAAHTIFASNTSSLTIAAMELLQSNLERRAAMTGDGLVFPRLSDFAMLLPAITGKVEMVYEGEQQGAEVVARKLIGQSLMKLFETKLPPVERAGVNSRDARERRGYGEIDTDDLDDAFSGRRGRKQQAPPPREEPKAAAKSEPAYDTILGWFVEGHKITVSDEQPFAEYFRELNRVPRLADTARKYVKATRDEELAFWMEMVLEGLHQALRLAREDLDSTITFSELMKFNVLRTVK